MTCERRSQTPGRRRSAWHCQRSWPPPAVTRTGTQVSASGGSAAAASSSALAPLFKGDEGFKWPWRDNDDGIGPRLFVAAVSLISGALVAQSGYQRTAPSGVLISSADQSIPEVSEITAN
jgi:hypothetical protein